MSINLTELSERMDAMGTLNKELLVAAKTKTFRKKGIQEGDLNIPTEIAEGLVFLAAFGRHSSRVMLSKLNLIHSLQETETKRTANKIDNLMVTFCTLTFHLLYPEMDSVRYKGVAGKSLTKNHFDIRPWVTEGMRAQKATGACAQEVMRKLIPYIYRDVSSLEGMILTEGFEFMLYLLEQSITPSEMAPYGQDTGVTKIPKTWTDAIIPSPHEGDLRDDVPGKLPSSYKSYYFDAFPTEIPNTTEKYAMHWVNPFLFLNLESIATNSANYDTHLASGAMVNLL